MALFDLTSKKNKGEQSFLSIDLGTEFIKIAVSVVRDGVKEVIGYIKEKQEINAMNGAMISNLKKVENTLDKALGKAIAMAKENATIMLPKSTIFGTAGELVKGTSILVNVDREDPNEGITQKELKETIYNVKKHTFEATIADVAEEIGLHPDQIKEISTVISSSYVDKTKVQNPVGMKASEINYRVFSTFAPKVQLESIYSIAEHLKISIDSIYVEPFAITKSIEGNIDQSAIIVDIGGGTTDIAVLQHNEFMGTQMFAIGGRTFTRRIQNDFNLDYIEAEELKLNYAHEKLDKTKAKEVSSSIYKDIRLWLKGVELSLAEFDDINEFPSLFYLCGGGSLLPEIQEGIMEYSWKSKLPFKIHPKVEFLQPIKVTDVIDKTRTAIGVDDVTPLALTHMI